MSTIASGQALPTRSQEFWGRVSGGYAGHAPDTEDPLAAIAEVTAWIGPLEVEVDLEFDPDYAPLRPTIRRSPGFDAPTYGEPGDGTDWGAELIY